ncbi:MAG: hypothetical protein U0350_09480 [Caldilineaceae bacterium]
MRFTYEERQPFPYALFTLGRIKRQQSDLAAAEQHFGEAMRIAQANSDPFIAAYIQRELGNLYYAQGLAEKAHPQWQAALHFLKTPGWLPKPRRRGNCWVRRRLHKRYTTTPSKNRM